MKHSFFYTTVILITLLTGCADNTFDELPNDYNFPFQIVLDADEGADLPDAEDYAIEVKFADYLPTLELPNTPITLTYQIKDLEDDMVGKVVIDKIVYEVELDDCVYERELNFTASSNGLTGIITIAADKDLGTVPPEFEVVLTLPGDAETEGSFTFELLSLEGSDQVLLGSPSVFEYEVLDHELAGEWELEITSEEEFDAFKEVFASVNPDIEALSFEDITGTIKAEFEFEEMKFEIELVETEEVTTCEDGEEETEIENKIIEFEAEYDAEDGEFVFEGSHETIGESGLVEDELDFMLEGDYDVDEDDETITFIFKSLIDEDNYEEGDELFKEEDGISFTFVKD